MKKLLFILGFVILIQGCAVYPPYGHSIAYNRYNYGYPASRPYGWGGGGYHNGWGGSHRWNGGRNGWGGGANNWGGHNGWGHGHH